jgi:hypothetical protein
VSATFGVWLKPGEFELVVGQDSYTTTTESVAEVRGRAPQEMGTLYRNGEPVKSLTATITAWYPSVALRDLAGIATWEFAGDDVATVVYDGHDLREVLGLQEVRRPHTINDKLIFVARRDGKELVVYDGHQVGPNFDEIFVAYCCEIALDSVAFGQDSYAFTGKRSGKPYVVLISAANAAQP